MLTVLNVGDGACSILRRAPDRGPVAVIDCGSTAPGPKIACEALLDAIGGKVEAISTIIVTHFDRDHYSGLSELAARMRERGQKFRHLEIVYPTVPYTEPTYAFMYLALSLTATGLRSMDLVSELGALAPGAFSHRAVAMGSRFEAAGHPFRVHWPPHSLDGTLARQVVNAIRRFEQLARSLEEYGDSTLLKNLEKARRGQWLRQTADDPHYPELVNREQSDTPADLEADVGAEDESSHEAPEPVLLPQQFHAEFRSVWTAFQRANNNMSLVFDDPVHRHLVAFGDAGHAVLQRVAKTGALSKFYAVMLAPHHGTHRLPPELDVGATLCVSQHGGRLGSLWDRHRNSHSNGNPCVTTVKGTVTAVAGTECRLDAILQERGVLSP